jgi:hypothetical protein
VVTARQAGGAQAANLAFHAAWALLMPCLFTAYCAWGDPWWATLCVFPILGFWVDVGELSGRLLVERHRAGAAA